jgi:ABC-type phosphate/phosphonate transport system permease subunit
MVTQPAPLAVRRDPAWVGRLFALLATGVVAWPLLVLAEFKPWTLLSPESLRPTLHFLGDFFPPKLEPEFLLLVAREPWRTVAIATAGIVLALGWAIPLALIAARPLSVSALSGRMAWAPSVVRQVVRWLLMLLRSVPELIWALIFVRVVGLGPTSGVLAIALTYAGMLGKVYAEILESSDAQPTQNLLRNGSGRLQHGFDGIRLGAGRGFFLEGFTGQQATEARGFQDLEECAAVIEEYGFPLRPQARLRGNHAGGDDGASVGIRSAQRAVEIAYHGLAHFAFVLFTLHQHDLALARMHDQVDSVVAGRSNHIHPVALVAVGHGDQFFKFGGGKQL